MSDWRDVLAETFNRHRDEWHRQERETISVGEAVMSLPPAARIAMARELLAGTECAVVPVGSRCPFDKIDNGGLAPEDACPICGDLGTFSPAGEDDPPSRCISGIRALPPVTARDAP